MVLFLICLGQKRQTGRDGFKLNWVMNILTGMSLCLHDNNSVGNFHSFRNVNKLSSCQNEGLMSDISEVKS